jgi:hypothetical protein
MRERSKISAEGTEGDGFSWFFNEMTPRERFDLA